MTVWTFKPMFAVGVWCWVICPTAVMASNSSRHSSLGRDYRPWRGYSATARVADWQEH